MQCKIPECSRPGVAREMCHTHYKRWQAHGDPTVVILGHGYSGKNRIPEYQVWNAMIQRCTNPRSKHYQSYGGRGIDIHPEWRHSFPAFLASMGSRPTPLHTLERKDNDKGYSPDNCVWATMKEQLRNTRFNRLLTVGSQTLCLSEWAEQTGTPYSIIQGRLRRGWTVERAITTPPAPDYKYKPRSN